MKYGSGLNRRYRGAMWTAKRARRLDANKLPHLKRIKTTSNYLIELDRNIALNITGKSVF